MQPTAPTITSSASSIAPTEPKEKRTNLPTIILTLTTVIFAGLAVFFGIGYFHAKPDHSVDDNESVLNTSGEANEATKDVVAKEENPYDYIYIGEWGVKIKKPENWRSIIKEYDYYNDFPGAVDTFEIVENPDIVTAHALLSKLGVSCDDVRMSYSACVDLNGEAIVISMPPAETEEISEAFRNWVASPSNYSAF